MKDWIYILWRQYVIDLKTMKSEEKIEVALLFLPTIPIAFVFAGNFYLDSSCLNFLLYAYDFILIIVAVMIFVSKISSNLLTDVLSEQGWQ